MKRPEFIESLESAAKGAATPGEWTDEICGSGADCWCRIVDTVPPSDRGVIPSGSVSAGDATHIAASNPANILELIRYVKVLERALGGRVRNSDPPQHVESQTAVYLDEAERELYPEAQP